MADFVLSMSYFGAALLLDCFEWFICHQLIVITFKYYENELFDVRYLDNLAGST